MNNRLQHVLNERRKRPLEIEQLEVLFDALTDEEKEEAIRVWEKESGDNKWWMLATKPVGKIWEDPKVEVQPVHKRSLWKKFKQRFLRLRLWIDKKTSPWLYKKTEYCSYWLRSFSRRFETNLKWREYKYRIIKGVGDYRDANGKPYREAMCQTVSPEMSKSAQLSKEEYDAAISRLVESEPHTEEMEVPFYNYVPNIEIAQPQEPTESP